MSLGILSRNVFNILLLPLYVSEYSGMAGIILKSYTLSIESCGNQNGSKYFDNLAYQSGDYEESGKQNNCQCSSGQTGENKVHPQNVWENDEKENKDSCVEGYEKSGKINSIQKESGKSDATTEPDLPRFLKTSLLIGNCFLATLPFGFLLGLGVLFVFIMDEFQSTRAATLPIISVYICIVFGGGGILGPLMNKFNAGKLCMIAAISSSVGCMICWFANSILVLILGVGLLTGFGLSASFLLPFTVVADMFNKNRVTMITVVSIFIGVGAVYFPYLTAVLNDEFGWRGTLLIVGAIFLNGVPIALLNTIFRNIVPSKNQDEGFRSMFNFSLFRNPAYLVVAFNLLMINTLFPALNMFFIDMLRGRGFDTADGPFLLSVYAFSGIAARICLAIVSPFCKVKRLTVWPIYISLTSLAVLMYVFVQNYKHLLAVSIVFGFGWGTCAVSFPAVIMEISGLKMYSTALGYVNFLGGIASLIGGPLAGFIKDTTQSYDLVYILTTSLGLFASSLMFLLTIVQKCCEKKSTKEEK